MATRYRRRTPQSTGRGPCRALIVPFRLVTLLAINMLGLLPPARATLDVTGQWSPNSAASQNGYAVHMMLLRGDSQPYHSRILWWYGSDNSGFSGTEWGWSQTSSGCGAFDSFSPIPVPPAGINVFCAGHVPLPDGRVLVAGGADEVTMTYGDNKARVLRDTTGTVSKQWYDPGPMAQWRWYPTETMLGGGSGRILVTAGERAPHHRVLFGRRNGSRPTGGVGDSLYRFFPVAGGQWDHGVIPAPDPNMNTKPVWREFHTAVQMEGDGNIKGHVIFGGLDASGTPLNDLWYLQRTPNYLGSDYAYNWLNKDGISPPSAPTAPSRRSHHTAVGVPADHTYMVIYGGRGQTGNALNDPNVYRLDDFGNGNWNSFTPSGTPAPSARFAHTAIFDSITIVPNPTLINRMIVGGGIGADNQTPTDLTVWQLQFGSDYKSGAWSALTQVAADHDPLQDRRPLPRYGHAMVWDSNSRYNARANKDGHVGFMFGGQLGATAYSDTLWLLWLFNDGTVGWDPEFPIGPAPSARARHTLVLDPMQGNPEPRLYLCGGEGTLGLADTAVYVVDPWAASPTWSKWSGLSTTLTGQTATLDYFETGARTPDVSDGRGWQPNLAASTLLQNTYPPTFVISGGPVTGDRVLALAQDNHSYYLDVAGSGNGNAWTQQANVGFAPEAGVAYSPNHIMVAGGTLGAPASAAVGTTKTLDTSNLTNTWQASGVASPLVPRTFTNLVALPNGTVIAIGGNGTIGQNNDSPVTVPQIWDPSTGNWTPGSGTGALASQPTVRTYHSTAILLPDGRVLSGGGNGTENLPAPHTNDQLKFNIFCPPYLFKSGTDSLAAPPHITSAPDTMGWGGGCTYTLLVQDTTKIRRAALMRPGATTHGFDQNQRYVPLTMGTASNPSRVLLSVPGSPADAPPGNYLLFVSGSSDATDVPSLASWVKVGSSGLDKNDQVPPATNTDFSVVCDPNTPNGWIVSWTATADDGVLAASGTVQTDNVRRSGSHITDSNWSSATSIFNQAGAAPGTPRSFTMAAAGCGTTYLRMKSVDNANHFSALSPEWGVFAWSSCSADCIGGGGMYAGGGGGGGGLRAGRAPEGASLQPTEGASFATGWGFSENSVLNGAAIGSSGHDALKLPGSIASGGLGTVRVREVTGRAAGLDAARLLVVDHASDVTAYGFGGSIVTGSQQSASRITATDGTDLTSVLNGSGSYAITPSDGLAIALGSGGGASPVVVAASGTGALQLEVPDSQGGWRVASQLTPRIDPDAIVFAAPGSDSVRIVTRGSASLSYIGRLALSATAPTVQAATLLSAQSATLGDVKSSVIARDSSSATLVGPDTLALTFSLPLATSSTREYFLVVDATPLNPVSLAPAKLGPASEVLPAAFALEQNRPNPFTGRTTIRFALPVPTPVRLEVFDLAGRRVRTLALGPFAAGYPSIEWDHRDAGGNLVRPGVYLYRLIAGSFSDQKKMVLLP